jgi:SAM-dependent methyltransferase
VAENSKIGIYNRWVSEKKEWENIEELLLFLKQKKAYLFASKNCVDKRILDCGCGSGYGSKFLSGYANQVIGVDINKEVIEYCISTHKATNLSFQNIYPNHHLPFDDNDFDVVVSFQVVEHIPDVPKYLFEIKRVLKNKGVLFITTPNRRHRLLPLQRPWNPEHLREYSLKDLYKELKHVFNEVKILGVYGIREINEIEYGRVKQSPFLVYLYKPLKKALYVILPYYLISALKQMKNKASSKTLKVSQNKLDQESISKYSLNDFTVDKNTEKCLDFLAICRK